MQSFLSELLINEHDVIQNVGRYIVEKENYWEDNPDDYARIVYKLLDFFKVYSDEYHHIKEEEILFPALAKKNDVVSNGIVQELVEHHEQFREMVANIRNSLALNDFATTQKLLEEYIEMLQDHIAVENDELFPMVDNIFSPDELEKLYYKCLDKDNELGLQRKEDFKDIIKNIN